jgi:hypothetical protein
MLSERLSVIRCDHDVDVSPSLFHLRHESAYLSVAETYLGVVEIQNVGEFIVGHGVRILNHLTAEFDGTPLRNRFVAEPPLVLRRRYVRMVNIHIVNPQEMRDVRVTFFDPINCLVSNFVSGDVDGTYVRTSLTLGCINSTRKQLVHDTFRVEAVFDTLSETGGQRRIRF